MAFYAYRRQAEKNDENIVFSKLCTELEAAYRDSIQNVYLLGGLAFELRSQKRNYEIDALLFINGTLVIIEIKSFGGFVKSCSKNNPWITILDNGKLKELVYKNNKEYNPYKQISQHKEGLFLYLKERYFIPKDKKMSKRDICGTLLFSKPVENLNDVNKRLLTHEMREWFLVADLLHSKEILGSFYRSTSLINESQIGQLIAHLHLEKFNSFSKIENDCNEFRNENCIIKNDIDGLLSKLKVQQKQLQYNAEIINNVKETYNNKLRPLVNELYNYKGEADEYFSHTQDNLAYKQFYYETFPKEIEAFNYLISYREQEFNVSEYGGYTEYVKEHLEKLAKELESDLADIENNENFMFLKDIYKKPGWFDARKAEVNNLIEDIENYFKRINEVEYLKKVRLQEEHDRLYRLEQEETEKQRAAERELEREKLRLEREQLNLQQKINEERKEILSQMSKFDSILAQNQSFIDDGKKSLDKLDAYLNDIGKIRKEFTEVLPSILNQAELFDHSYNGTLKEDVKNWADSYSKSVDVLLQRVLSQKELVKKASLKSLILQISAFGIAAWLIWKFIASLGLFGWIILILIIVGIIFLIINS